MLSAPISQQAYQMERKKCDLELSFIFHPGIIRSCTDVGSQDRTIRRMTHGVGPGSVCPPIDMAENTC